MVVARFIIYKDEQGEFRWRLRAASSEVVAESTEAFPTKEECEKRIEDLREQIPTSEIIDMSRRGGIIR